MTTPESGPATGKQVSSPMRLVEKNTFVHFVPAPEEEAGGRSRCYSDLTGEPAKEKTYRESSPVISPQLSPKISPREGLDAAAEKSTWSKDQVKGSGKSLLEQVKGLRGDAEQQEPAGEPSPEASEDGDAPAQDSGSLVDKVRQELSRPRIESEISMEMAGWSDAGDDAPGTPCSLDYQDRRPSNEGMPPQPSFVGVPMFQGVGAPGSLPMGAPPPGMMWQYVPVAVSPQQMSPQMSPNGGSPVGSGAASPQMGSPQMQAAVPMQMGQMMMQQGSPVMQSVSPQMAAAMSPQMAAAMSPQMQAAMSPQGQMSPHSCGSPTMPPLPTSMAAMPWSSPPQQPAKGGEIPGMVPGMAIPGMAIPGMQFPSLPNPAAASKGAAFPGFPGSEGIPGFLPAFVPNQSDMQAMMQSAALFPFLAQGMMPFGGPFPGMQGEDCSTTPPPRKDKAKKSSPPKDAKKPEKKEKADRPSFTPPERDPNVPLTELTLMLKNIPNKYKPDMLLAEFKEWREFMDFYYMPIDFKNNCNLGYAFVNFHDVQAAQRFRAVFHNLRLPMYQQSNKVLSVSEARVQGLDSYIERFRNSSVMADGVLKPEYKPLLFDRQGQVKEFPQPDGDLPALGPRFRRQR